MRIINLPQENHRFMIKVHRSGSWDQDDKIEIDIDYYKPFERITYRYDLENVYRYCSGDSDWQIDWSTEKYIK